MAKVNFDILGISELKWNGTSEFNSDDHYIYYCGQESLRRNGVVIRVNKRVQNTVLGCNLKNDRMISVWFQGKPFRITVIQVYAMTSNPEEAEVERCYENLQDLLEQTPKKRHPFHYRGLECKSRKSRNTWSNRQIWPWSTELSRAKANRVYQKNALVIAKPSSNNTREDSTHGHHQMVNTKTRLIIFFAAKDGEALYSQEKQDQELTVAQTMSSLLPNSDLNWRKWGKPLGHSVMT